MLGTRFSRRGICDRRADQLSVRRRLNSPVDPAYVGRHPESLIVPLCRVVAVSAIVLDVDYFTLVNDEHLLRRAAQVAWGRDRVEPSRDVLMRCERC